MHRAVDRKQKEQPEAATAKEHAVEESFVRIPRDLAGRRGSIEAAVRSRRNLPRETLPTCVQQKPLRENQISLRWPRANFCLRASRQICT